MLVELHGQRLARVLQGRDMRQEALGVDVHGMATGRLHDRDACLGNVPRDVLRGGDAVVQVVLLHHFFQADGDGVQVARGEHAAGGIAGGHLRTRVVVEGRALILGDGLPLLGEVGDLGRGAGREHDCGEKGQLGSFHGGRSVPREARSCRGSGAAHFPGRCTGRAQEQADCCP